jgi:Ni/Co efflux regulator RcnB
MNYLKKTAFALALIAGLCGGAWAQDWAHRDRDHDRDNQRWRDHDRRRDWDHDRDHDRDRDRDYRYRNGQWGYQNRGWGGNYPYYPNGTYYPNQSRWGYGYPGTYPGTVGTWGYGAPTYGYGASNVAYQTGYNDGLATGRADRSFNRPFNPNGSSVFRKGTHGYNNSYGSKAVYGQAYRNAFIAGYRAGYGGGAYGRRW